ncbi:MAG: tRNA epoxyqueuosine(34) reductase QueG [Limnochordia bacterium]|nr:tRNA epoxyqueuosine(34) reductase QueG [Limnochordia bacterium]
MTLTEKLYQRAYELGIDALSIIPVSRFSRLAHLLQRRENKLSPWAPQDLAKAVDPSLILPGAKSILCTAISYNNTVPHTSGLVGQVARFARVRDYHRVFSAKLQELGQYLENLTGAEFRVCVDTGPLFDREAAYLAGIGWYGKNNCIIVPRLGSWVFLGEMITTSDLTPSFGAPLPSRCGSCNRCIKACPTQALQPFGLDHTKCLSYLTQSKDYVSPKLWPLFGDSLYGCDRCQEVCPHNHDTPTNLHNEFIPTGVLAHPLNLAWLMELSTKGFTKHLGSTPMGWAGKSTLQRNGIILLANQGTKDAKLLIKKAAQSNSPLVRECAQDYLERV